MIKGFTLVEVLVVSALTFVLISMIVSNVTETNRCSQKIIGNQQRMEAIFHTVDAIRSDLSRCGMRLREASETFGFATFENTGQSFRVLFGVGEEMLLDDCWLEETAINVNRNDYFSKGKEIMIYDRERRCFEFNKISGRSGDWLLLSNELQNNYSKNSMIVALKEVEYRIYEKENVLKRKVNRGYFQPLIEGVTDFNISYFPESDSVLYRLEVNHKEQVRGYIFLTNQVEK
jgi:type II secretory pathway component PulJ